MVLDLGDLVLDVAELGEQNGLAIIIVIHVSFNIEWVFLGMKHVFVSFLKQLHLRLHAAKQVDPAFEVLLR